MQYNDESLPLRYRITSYLNAAMMGFLEGDTDSLCQMVSDNIKRLMNVDVPRGSIRIVVDDLQNPIRKCLSIHIDHEGEHYESVIVNLKYDTGCDDY